MRLKKNIRLQKIIPDFTKSFISHIANACQNLLVKMTAHLLDSHHAAVLARAAYSTINTFSDALRALTNLVHGSQEVTGEKIQDLIKTGPYAEQIKTQLIDELNNALRAQAVAFECGARALELEDFKKYAGPFYTDQEKILEQTATKIIGSIGTVCGGNAPDPDDDNSRDSAQKGQIPSSVPSADQIKKDAKIILDVDSKKAALEKLSDLPEKLRKSFKNMLGKSSHDYNKFRIYQLKDGNYLTEAVNPGRVPGSYASYYKVISAEGNTLRVFKETFAPGNIFVHSKVKHGW